MTRVKIDHVTYGEENGEWRVEATTKRGHRFHFWVGAERLTDYERVKRFVKAVEQRGSIDPTLWTEGYPVYGSDAFVEQETQAFYYAQQVRAGHCALEDVPSCYRELL